MAGLTYFTARQFILHERETAILRQALRERLSGALVAAVTDAEHRPAPRLPGHPARVAVRSRAARAVVRHLHLRRRERHSPPAALPRPLGHPGHPALRPRRFAPAGGGPPRPERGFRLLRGLLARRVGPHPPDPGSGPGRRRPRHHGGRRRHRPVGQRSGSAPARRGLEGGRDHRRWSSPCPSGGGRRSRPLGPGGIVQPDGRRPSRAHRARGPLHVRRQPRAPLPSHHAGHVVGRPRVAPRRPPRAQPRPPSTC